MKKAAIVLFATAGLFGAPALAQQQPPQPQSTPPQLTNVQACLDKVNQNSADLPARTKQTQDQLVHDPSQIGAVISSANAAGGTTKTEIELGIVRAIQTLKCTDPTGYQALNDYLKGHAGDPVVAEIDQALGALAQVGGGGGGAGGGGGGGGAGGGGGGFSSSPGSPATSS